MQNCLIESLVFICIIRRGPFSLSNSRATKKHLLGLLCAFVTLFSVRCASDKFPPRPKQETEIKDFSKKDFQYVFHGCIRSNMLLLEGGIQGTACNARTVCSSTCPVYLPFLPKLVFRMLFKCSLRPATQFLSPFLALSYTRAHNGRISRFFIWLWSDGDLKKCLVGAN
jgi:hypothetical protein